MLFENGVNGGLIFHEAVPFRLLQPERVSGQPQSIEPFSLCLFKPVNPALKHEVGFEPPTRGVPLSVQNLQLSVGDVYFEGFNISCQSSLGLRSAKWFGSDPNADLVILEAHFEIGDQSVDQFLPVLVELAEVSTPRDITNSGDPCVPHFIRFNGCSGIC